MKSLLSIIFLFTVSIFCIPETWALERIRWKVQVISNEVYWVELWKEYVEIVKQLSDGKIRFKIYDQIMSFIFFCIFNYIYYKFWNNIYIPNLWFHNNSNY